MQFLLSTEMPDASAYLSFLPLVILIVLFYFMLIRPQRKREKKEKLMRDSIETGDRICTIGGIIGRVVSVSDDEFVLETSGSTRIRFNKWAIRNRIEDEE
ncbi:MAG: preprotein translocase subunit YajC [Eubacteriales bacterium]|nr:preprotein translocase subunit YajC [Eubacteriales bacterium]